MITALSRLLQSRLRDDAVLARRRGVLLPVGSRDGAPLGADAGLGVHWPRHGGRGRAGPLQGHARQFHQLLPSWARSERAAGLEGHRQRLRPIRHAVWHRPVLSTRRPPGQAEQWPAQPVLRRIRQADHRQPGGDRARPRRVCIPARHAHLAGGKCRRTSPSSSAPQQMWRTFICACSRAPCTVEGSSRT